MADESTQPDKQRPEGPQMIRVEYYHSAEGHPQEQQEKVRNLGLTRVGQIVTRPNTVTMHHIVSDLGHLIRIIE